MSRIGAMSVRFGAVTDKQADQMRLLARRTEELQTELEANKSDLGNPKIIAKTLPDLITGYTNLTKSFNQDPDIVDKNGLPYQAREAITTIGKRLVKFVANIFESSVAKQVVSDIQAKNGGFDRDLENDLQATLEEKQKANVNDAIAKVLGLKAFGD
jgi:hypothetical protein